MKKLILLIIFIGSILSTSVIIAKTGVKIFYNDGTFTNISSDKIKYLQFYDNDDNYPDIDYLMRPISIAWYDNGEDEPNYKFYDIVYENGLKVISYSSKEDDYGEYITYSYSSNNITKTFYNKEKTDILDEEIFGLSNNRIVSSSDYRTFEYKDDFLTNIYYSILNTETTYKWSEDLIIQRDYNSSMTGYETCNYYYTDKPMYVWIQSEFGGAAEEFYEHCDPFLVRQGFYGKIPKYLVKQANELYPDGGKDVLNFDYEFNENGYPTKIYRKYADGNNYNDYVIIEWEKY